MLAYVIRRLWQFVPTLLGVMLLVFLLFNWIGGDPAKLEVYGWASWSPEKAIVALRNPSDHPQDFNADIASLLELPAHTTNSFTASSPWKADGVALPFSIPARHHSFHLQPFQVLTLELVPDPSQRR